MPFYEYACKKCNDIIELFFKIADRPSRAPCSKCGEDAEFIISAPNFNVPGGADTKVKPPSKRET